MTNKCSLWNWLSGQSQCEPASLACPALHMNRSSQHVHDALDQSQPEAKAPHLARQVVRDLIKTAERVRYFVFWDADAGILEKDFHLGSFPSCLDRDASPFPVKADRVEQQLFKRRLHEFRVG